MQSRLRTLKLPSLVGLLLVASTVIVLAQSGATSAAPDNDVCVTATLTSDSSIKSLQGDCATIATEEVTEESSATCDAAEFQANPGVSVKCELTSTNWAQDVYTVTVSTKATTPVRWNIDVNNKLTKGFIKADLDSLLVFDRWTAMTRQYSVTGTDRSWNADPNAANNYAFVSDNKTQTFTMRVTWR